MLSISEINQLKNQLPPKYMDELANETGFSKPTISKFFNGKKIRASNVERIYDAALKIIREHKVKMDERRQQLNSMSQKDAQIA